MTSLKCADCESETHYCIFHQKADIEFEGLDKGDVQKEFDEDYIQLQKKYGEDRKVF